MSEHKAYVQRLARLDCCAVSDALDALGLVGTVTGLVSHAANRRIAGRAITVKLVRASEAIASPGVPRHLCTQAVEQAGPGDVIVVEQRSGIDAGCWGGMLTLGASLRGVEGVIAEGPVRDIDEASQYDFPVFARGLTAFTARGRVAEAGTGVPVMVGEVAVCTNDYVIADRSAVIFIAESEIARVLATAERIALKEAHMARRLMGGLPIAQVMGADYENMLKD